MDELIKYLDEKKPTYTLIYFTAAWNPTIPLIEKDYENLTREFSKYTHIRVDCDAVPQLKNYFDARVEPQFLILLNGAELKRIVGFNFEKIAYSLEQATELHLRDFTYHGDSKETWERFYDTYDRWARFGEYDRDSLRVVVDSQVDRHRGAGTN